MSRCCDLTGTRAMSGNNVSHSNRKSKTRFQPNLQHVTLLSDALDRGIPLRITAATLRTVEHNGGLDAFLVKHSDSKLTAKAVRLKRQVKKKLKDAEAA